MGSSKVLSCVPLSGPFLEQFLRPFVRVTSPLSSFPGLLAVLLVPGTVLRPSCV
jgi:hypothetical protein